MPVSHWKFTMNLCKSLSPVDNLNAFFLSVFCFWSKYPLKKHHTLAREVWRPWPGMPLNAWITCKLHCRQYCTASVLHESFLETYANTGPVFKLMEICHKFMQLPNHFLLGAIVCECSIIIRALGIANSYVEFWIVVGQGEFEEFKSCNTVTSRICQ